MADSGKSVRLFINTGTETAPVWTVIAQQTGMTVSESRDSESIQHKDSEDAIAIPGQRTRTIQVDGLVFRQDGAQSRLLDAMSSGEELRYRVYEGGIVLEEQPMVLTSLSRSYPVSGSATYTANLAGSKPTIRFG